MSVIEIEIIEMIVGTESKDIITKAEKMIDTSVINQSMLMTTIESNRTIEIHIETAETMMIIIEEMMVSPEGEKKMTKSIQSQKSIIANDPSLINLTSQTNLKNLTRARNLNLKI